MRTTPLRTPSRRLVFAPLLALALIAACITSAPAVATTPKVPHYSLSVVEGETTLPEESIVNTSARVDVEPHPEVVVSIVRGGIVVAREHGKGGTWLSQVPQVGDVVNLESPAGTLIGSVVYDGLPSIDPTVCAGSVNFSGQRSGAQEVRGGFYSYRQTFDHYGHPNGWQKANFGNAQVTLLSGPNYAGNFLVPLALGQTVWAEESLETPLAGGAVFTYSSENVRPVGACPVPPAPPAPPPPPALQGTVLKLLHTTIAKLLKFGWRNLVTINQPGTVTEDLYMQGGTLPAYASKAKHRAKPALLLARGSASAKSAGKVVVVIHATKRGRHVLKSAKHLRAVLVTTLRSASGAKLSLVHRSVTLHR